MIERNPLSILLLLVLIACDDGAGIVVTDGGLADASAADAMLDAGPADMPRIDAAPADAAVDASMDAAVDARVDADVDAMPPGFSAAAEQICPGDPDCPASDINTLQAGASAQPISDLGFEVPLEAYLRSMGCSDAQPGPCGQLSDAALRNCGTDGLCPDDPGYMAPDADGTEGDVNADGDPIYDYYRDCGLDGLCPGDADYVAPDEGEGNGRFDGLWLAGFGTNRPATGVRDPAWARTVAIEQGEILVTLTSIDAVGLFYDDIEAIRALARAELARVDPALDIDFMLISSTHSHEVPDTMGQWGGEVAPGGLPMTSGISPRYMAHLRARAAASIVEAIQARRPVTAEVGSVQTGAAGLVRDSRPPIIIDDTLGALRLVDMTDQTVATVVNWGNHPEVLSSKNNLITSDFAHALRAGVEEGVGDRAGLGGVTVYLQGSVGGLMTPLGVPVDGSTEPTFARADAMGRRLAEATYAALDGAEALDTPALAFAATEFLVPIENTIFRLAFQIGLLDRAIYDAEGTQLAEFQGTIGFVKTQALVLTLGPLTLYSVPGELFPELAVGGYDGSRSFGEAVVPDDPLAPDLSAAPQPPYLHDLMPGRHRWVIGLGMDELGYMVPPYDFKLNPALPYLSEAEGDHYEETNSVGPEIVPRTQVVLKALADAIEGR